LARRKLIKKCKKIIVLMKRIVKFVPHLIPWQMIYYANAAYAFIEPTAGNDNSKGTAYNEVADKRSWQHLQLFLADLFK
jgi:dienelactone hydrolase